MGAIDDRILIKENQFIIPSKGQALSIPHNSKEKATFMNLYGKEHLFIFPKKLKLIEIKSKGGIKESYALNTSS